MNFDIVVATSGKPCYGIGFQGKIPWKCSEDMRFFRKLTTLCPEGKINAVIMGRKTFESIGKILPERLNIVVTSSFIDGVICVKDFNTALEKCRDIKTIFKVFVIGGGQLYKEALKSPYLEKIYINHIRNVTDYQYDTFFDDTYLEPAFLESFKETEAMISEVYNYKICINPNEESYLSLLREIIESNNLTPTRNGNTLSIFGKTLVFDLKNSFPLLTTKKMFLRGVFEELMWFLRGQTDSKILESKKVNIWKGNSSKEFLTQCNLPYQEGDVGNMYGFQLRHFSADYNGCNEDYSGKGFDQLEKCMNLLKNDPHSRRIIMTTFDPSRAHQGVLYPCHGICIQFYVFQNENKNYLSCAMTQRSADSFLGLPFNIASYALLVYLICDCLNQDKSYRGSLFVPDKLTMFLGDVHIYESHMDAVKEQISRRALEFPRLNIVKSHENIEDYQYEDIKLDNYNSYPPIKAEMVV